MIKQWYTRKGGKFVKASDFPFSSPQDALSSQEPSEAEAALVLAELNDAIATAERIVWRMDSTHALLQDCIREVREAREIVAQSNQQAKLRAGAAAA